MLSNLIEMLQSPESYVAEWRDGELFITPTAEVVHSGEQCPPQL